MTEHRLEREGVTVHYETHGVRARTPLLLSHGFGATSAMWAGDVEALGAERMVITWDVRGHGRTTVPPDQALFTTQASVGDMAAILDACGIERAVVGGLSLGGYLSLAFHLAHRARVAALVLVDTGPGFKSDEGRARWNRYATSQANALESRGLDALSPSPETHAGADDPIALARAARGLLTQSDSSVITSLASIGVPALVIVGAEDAPFLAAAGYMAAKIPRCRKVVIAGAGHASNIDRPAEFQSAVLAFLDELDGDNADPAAPP